MKQRISTRFFICSAILAILIAASHGAALSLVKAATSATNSDLILTGSNTYSLDLRLNTEGLPVSGLQYYFLTTPANAWKFGAAPVTALDTPFTASDLFSAPTMGTTVNQSASTVFFKASAGDYAPFSNNAIVRYVFDTSTLSPGTYVITPIGEELTNANTTVTAFSAPASFTLTVQIVPEPATLILFAAGGIALLARRRRAA